MNKRTVTIISAVVSIIVCTAQELLPLPLPHALGMGMVEPPASRVDCACEPQCKPGAR